MPDPSSSTLAQERIESAIEILRSPVPAAVLDDPDLLAALASPGEYSGDVESAYAAIREETGGTALVHAIRRAARDVVISRRESGRRVAQTVAYDRTRPPVVVLGSHAYVWSRGDYRLIGTDLVGVELDREGHETTRSTDSGSRPLTWPELYALYGVRVGTVEYEMGGTSRVDGSRLILGCCALDASIRPERSPDVEEWLEHLAGQQLGALLDWLATSGRTQEPTAACYLQGPPSTGKGLLALGVGRMWSTQITTYASVVLGSWTQALIRQPLIWLDERAPRDVTDQGSAAFRRVTGNSVHPYSAKFQPDATIRGCPRLLITSNHDDALRFGSEDLLREDEEAIGRRILHIRVQQAAADYLEARGGRQGLTRYWIEEADGSPGALPRHLAWLAQTRKVTPGSRYLVEGDAAGWLRSHASRAGLPQRILVALARWATDPDVLPRDAGHPCSVDRAKRQLRVRATDLHAVWGILSGDDRSISIQAIGRALSRLGELDRGRTRCHLISVDQVVEAAEATGIGDPEAILRRCT